MRPYPVDVVRHAPPSRPSRGRCGRRAEVDEGDSGRDLALQRATVPHQEQIHGQAASGQTPGDVEHRAFRPSRLERRHQQRNPHRCYVRNPPACSRSSPREPFTDVPLRLRWPTAADATRPLSMRKAEREHADGDAREDRQGRKQSHVARSADAPDPRGDSDRHDNGEPDGEHAARCRRVAARQQDTEHSAHDGHRTPRSRQLPRQLCTDARRPAPGLHVAPCQPNAPPPQPPTARSSASIRFPPPNADDRNPDLAAFQRRTRPRNLRRFNLSTGKTYVVHARHPQSPSPPRRQAGTRASTHHSGLHMAVVRSARARPQVWAQSAGPARPRGSPQPECR